jgi:excisionase family DNA binding protein
MLQQLLEVNKIPASHAVGPEEQIMSAKEVAEFLRLDLNIIYNKCTKGEIPYFRVGKLYKFKKSEILAWIKKQHIASVFSVDDYVDRYLQKNQLKG